MNTTTPETDGRRSQAGFTLVETLVAVIVLVFGLMAVTNLLLVAASANTVANQSSGATASAVRVMDTLRSSPYLELCPGVLIPSGSCPALQGDLDNDTTTPSPDCQDLPVPITGVFNCDEVVPGVGTIKTRWTITAGAGTARLLQITVRSEGQGALAGARSRATFTTYRACTQSTRGSCPTTGLDPAPNGQCCPN
jgi:type II secretory pathway pseudopilin PulG